MPTNGQLRTYQIVVFIVSGTAGLVVSISMGWTTNILSGACVLYSNTKLTKFKNGSLFLREDESDWGKPVECSFCTFCPVGVTIYCIIWIWFYIFLSDWGTFFIEDKPKQVEAQESMATDQHLLIPSIVSNVLVLGLLLSTVAIVEAGRSEWCEHLTQTIGEPCSYVGEVDWLNVKDGDDIYGYLTHARISCWVLLIAMIFQTMIIFVRLRRNSRRPRHQSFDSDASSQSDIFDEAFRSKVVDITQSSVSDNLPDSDQSADENVHRRRLLTRQKKVVIDDGSHDDMELLTASAERQREGTVQFA